MYLFQDGIDVVYESIGGEVFDTCVNRYVQTVFVASHRRPTVISQQGMKFYMYLYTVFPCYIASICFSLFWRYKEGGVITSVAFLCGKNHEISRFIYLQLSITII
jgi:hypothetical protein